MKYAEALTALIDQQHAHNVRSYASLQGSFAPPTRDETAARNENIRISASVIGWLNEDKLYKADDVEYGTFDNCREYGLTMSVNGWTFCVYEHRNSDAICIEGCPTDKVQSYGPYAGVDKYDVLASFGFREYHKAVKVLEGMIDLVRAKGDDLARDDLQQPSGKR